MRAAVDREIAKLERTSEQSPELGWIRTWLDTVLEIPWDETSEDNLDTVAAKRVLDEDHDGLVDVKERILEHLAVRKLQAERGLAPVGRSTGAILALVGPPGVGKTSLGESVARAPSGASSCGSRSEVCATRRRSAATGAPTWARSQVAWLGRSGKRGR